MRLERAASPGIRPGLARIARLAACLGHPERAFPSVQIVGTNGKGSTAATLDSIARASGLLTGRYTSPHLVSPGERTTVGGEPLSPDDWEEGAERLFSALRDEPRLKGSPPTLFELLTLLAFERFARLGVDLAVVEAGMGGRFDATSLLGEVLAVGITPIGLDHQEYLGDTLEAIGQEKFAVVRPGRPALFAGEPEGLIPLFRERCRRIGARDSVPEREGWTLEGVSPSLEGTSFSLEGPEFPRALLRTPLIGPHQARNAAFAVALAWTLRERFPRIDPVAVAKGVARTEWPGRLQVLRSSPLLLLDGAHNAHGIAALVRAVEALRPPSPVVLVFAGMRDKDLEGELGQLRVLGDDLILSEVPGNPRSASASDLARRARAVGWPNVRAVPDPIEAIRWAFQSGQTTIACGSLYFVGAILARREEIP